MNQWNNNPTRTAKYLAQYEELLRKEQERHQRRVFKILELIKRMKEYLVENATDAR